MTLICLASQKGSPGTTMTSLAVAAALQVTEGRQKVMVEADCTGGTLAIRYQLPVEPGLLTLAAAVRGGVDVESMWRHTQELPGGLRVVVCPDGPDQVHAAMSASGAVLGRFLNQLGNVDVICDVGRLAPDSPALAFVAEASALLMVARPTAEQLQPAARRMMAMRPQVDNIGWILVGERPYGPAEIEATYKFPVVGVVADDARAVARLEQGLMTKRLRRSPFVRSSATLATTLSSWLAPLQSTEAGVEEPEQAPAPATRSGISPRLAAPAPTSSGGPAESDPPAPPATEITDPSFPLTGVPEPSAPVADPPNPGREGIPAASAPPPVSVPAPVPPSPVPPTPTSTPPTPTVAAAPELSPDPTPPSAVPPPPSPGSAVAEQADWPAPVGQPSPADPVAAAPASIPTPPTPDDPVEPSGSPEPVSSDPQADRVDPADAAPPRPPAPRPSPNGSGDAADVDLSTLPPPPEGHQPLDPTPPAELTNGDSAPHEPNADAPPAPASPPSPALADRNDGPKPWPYGSPADPDRPVPPPPPGSPIPDTNGDGWDTEIFTRTIDFEELLSPAEPAPTMPPVPPSPEVVSAEKAHESEPESRAGDESRVEPESRTDDVDGPGPEAPESGRNGFNGQDRDRPRRIEPPSPFPHEDLSFDDWGRG